MLLPPTVLPLTAAGGAPAGPGSSVAAGVGLAVVAAVLLTLGTGLQTSRGGRGRWWAGTVVLAAGAATGAAALALAPVSLVQPVGVLALPLAVGWAASRSRRRVGPGEAAAVVCCVVGVAAVLALIGLAGVDGPVLGAGVGRPGSTWPAWLAVTAGASAGLAGWRRAPGAGRVLLLTVGAGLAFGTVATLTRLLLPVLLGGEAPDAEAAAALVMAAASGLLMLRAAGRAGHHGLMVGALTVTDPLVAVGLGSVLLGEPLPQGAAGTAALVAAAVAVLGVLVLARSTPHPGHGAAGVPVGLPGPRRARPAPRTSPLVGPGTGRARHPRTDGARA